MDELHAAIATYLRRHNPRYLTPGPPPVPRDVVRCRLCGRPITGGSDGAALGTLLARTRCLGCYLREAA